MLTPQVLIERLLALVPRPRRHQLTYYGVLAPAAGLRSRVVPQRELGDEVGAVAGAPSVPEGVEADHGDRSPKRDLVPHRPAARRRGGGLASACRGGSAWPWGLGGPDRSL